MATSSAEVADLAAANSSRAAALIDHAAHDNDLERIIPEVIELHEVVVAVEQRADIRDTTLIIVTADHETGGLSVEEYSEGDVFPAVSWSTDYHTGVRVPLYASGPGSQLMWSATDNTYIFDRIIRLLRL